MDFVLCKRRNIWEKYTETSSKFLKPRSVKMNLVVVGVQTFASKKFCDFVNFGPIRENLYFQIFFISNLGKVYAHELQKFPLSLFFFLISFFKKIMNRSIHSLEFMLTKYTFGPNSWKFIPKISWILRTLKLFAWESFVSLK